MCPTRTRYNKKYVNARCTTLCVPTVCTVLATAEAFEWESLLEGASVISVENDFLPGSTESSTGLCNRGTLRYIVLTHYD